MSDGHHGDAQVLAEKDALTERWLRENPSDFLERVVRKLNTLPNGCWEWTGSPTATYGRVRFPKSLGVTAQTGNAPFVSVHRVIWIAIKGHIPFGSVLDHDGPRGCRNRKCANPAHLVVATPQQNVLSGNGPAARNAAKQFCVAGHPIHDPKYLMPSGIARGKRTCRACARATREAHMDIVRRAKEALGLSWSQYTAQHGRSKGTAQLILASIDHEGDS